MGRVARDFEFQWGVREGEWCTNGMGTLQGGRVMPGKDEYSRRMVGNY